MKPITVSLPRHLRRRWNRWACKAFPSETLGYILGQRVRGGLSAFELYIPSDVSDYADEVSIDTPDHWLPEADEAAAEVGLRVIGRVHTHPRKWSDWAGSMEDAGQSETDLKPGWDGAEGITLVVEQEDGSLRCRTRFYGPSRPAVTTT